MATKKDKTQNEWVEKVLELIDAEIIDSQEALEDEDKSVDIDDEGGLEFKVSPISLLGAQKDLKDDLTGKLIQMIAGNMYNWDTKTKIIGPDDPNAHFTFIPLRMRTIHDFSTGTERCTSYDRKHPMRTIFAKKCSECKHYGTMNCKKVGQIFGIAKNAEAEGVFSLKLRGKFSNIHKDINTIRVKTNKGLEKEDKKRLFDFVVDLSISNYTNPRQKIVYNLNVDSVTPIEHAEKAAGALQTLQDKLIEYQEEQIERSVKYIESLKSAEEREEEKHGGSKQTDSKAPF